ncbi:LacI-type regulatory protein (plasmid) [Alkalihalophilus pseudofirmus OF4]|uniref:LacI-type regulatory protein n=1 Tax=Alkalihalophilus pseudofirmus (strain ATCC BAA-2126 / JCM 17055 / OF4) TaxID=398511 RepID=D3G1V5_ALKPO|nr:MULTISPECIES: LacI family DNA-binding transcriptional regulator [Alkalihalophilus]ADC52331.1 LacI-type regulatory protein [Alkalihalophilus pseudofirmus OF4]MED1603332.1 LacI family DNA-binding transcriptional regulator [Alkalihalophilus marmarensis]
MSNITEIAKRAKVSRTTVSRVLNNHPYVKKEKRESVLRAIEELNYVPNMSAINLSKGKTNVFGVIVPQINHSFFSNLIEGIGKECNKHNYSLLVLQSNYDIKKELKYFDMLKNKVIDGMIVGSSIIPTNKINDLSSSGKIISCEYSASEKFPRVFVDHESGFKLAVDHLKSKGHQKIGLCLGNPKSGVGITRKKSFFNLLREYQLTWNNDWYFDERYTIYDGIKVASKLLDNPVRPTAVVVGSDQVAAGILYEVKRRGIRIPEDLALIGFDDQPIAKVLDLTTINQPIIELGEVAANLLYRLVNGEGIHADTKLELELVERKSV